MKIAAVMGAHANPSLIIDTLDSISAYMTEKIIIVVDGVQGNKLKDVELPKPKLIGFPHGSVRAPYRNVALGLKSLYETYPNEDWYCHCEYDCLWGSDRFRQNLRLADEKGIWMLGNCGRIDHARMPLVESLIGENFRSVYYLLGACQFFSKHFMRKLVEIDFFDRFLNLTNGHSEKMPQYEGYDISEHMYPTLARHFGGHIGVFSSYESKTKEWHGSYEIFPIRWRPELDSETENFPDASIMHPLKDYDHPIRVHHRKKRLECEKSLSS